MILPKDLRVSRMKTEVFKIGGGSVYAFDGALKRAANIIKKGGLVVFPTETVYGLGGDATNSASAEKIFKAKGRPSDNPLIIHLSCPEEAEKYTYTNGLYYKLAERFMPGPLTVVLPSKETIAKETRASLDTVAVRCPENAVARRLIELSGVPIAAPSANLSGSPSPTSAQHVIDDMMGRVDMIIDGGPSDFGLESTIVKIDGENSLTLLRPGKITPEELSELAEVKLADAVLDKLRDGETALSPGMKYRHYAPDSPLVLLSGSPSSISEYIKKENKEKIALIVYNEDRELFGITFPNADIYLLGSKVDELEQSHRLFSCLREANKRRYDEIYAPLPKKRGIGLALYNRMIRAAAHRIINLEE